MASCPGYKVVLVGDSNAGKSSLVLRFTHDRFDAESLPTVAMDYNVKKVRVQDQILKLKLWDTAGQSRFQSLIPMYIAEADALLIVYDITKRDSFACARNWIESLQHGGPSGALLALVGNKADMAKVGAVGRAVSTDEAQLFSKEKNVLFTETSAKTGENVTQLFAQISEHLPGRPRILPQRLGASLDSDEEEPQVQLPQPRRCCLFPTW